MSDEKQNSKNEEQMETTESAFNTGELNSQVKDPGFWKEILEQFRLAWLLLRDKDVPIYLKLLPLAAFIYVIFPADLLPDFLFGLGQLDDITAVILGAKMFIEMSPQDIVNRHLQAMRMRHNDVDLDGVEPSDKEIDASIVIEGEFEQVENKE